MATVLSMSKLVSLFADGGARSGHSWTVILQKWTKPFGPNNMILYESYDGPINWRLRRMDEHRLHCIVPTDGDVSKRFQLQGKIINYFSFQQHEAKID